MWNEHMFTFEKYESVSDGPAPLRSDRAIDMLV